MTVWGDYYAFALERSAEMTLTEVTDLQRLIEAFIRMTEASPWRGNLENHYVECAKRQLVRVRAHRRQAANRALASAMADDHDN